MCQMINVLADTFLLHTSMTLEVVIILSQTFRSLSFSFLKFQLKCEAANETLSSLSGHKEPTCKKIKALDLKRTPG